MGKPGVKNNVEIPAIVLVCSVDQPLFVIDRILKIVIQKTMAAKYLQKITS